ncbi:hypothetical protein GCM10020219_099900 [Nonomuraea dietziae]
MEREVRADRAAERDARVVEVVPSLGVGQAQHQLGQAADGRHLAWLRPAVPGQVEAEHAVTQRERPHLRLPYAQRGAERGPEDQRDTALPAVQTMMRQTHALSPRVRRLTVPPTARRLTERRKEKGCARGPEEQARDRGENGGKQKKRGGGRVKRGHR